MSVFSKHNDCAGFFSCCSVKLCDIINYINTNKKTPKHVHSSESFTLYKKDNWDVTYLFFETYDDKEDPKIQYPIRFSTNDQFINYSELDYNNIIPLVKKYFYPSNKITDNIKTIKEKYNITYSNTVGVYFRGTDKYVETTLPSYDSFYAKIKEISEKNKNKHIIIQTDTSQFIDYIKKKNNSNITIINEISSTYLKDGIHRQKTRQENQNDMLILFSIFLILSKCSSIICSSSNCSLWIMLYRNNNKNVHQYLTDRWLS